MAGPYSPSSIDPANRGNLAGTIQLILTKFLQEVDDMLPATVVSYDRESNRAVVQPLISVVTTDGKRVNRASVASVPVLQMGGGGFVLSFPVKAGDLGWIKANDRDISVFLQSLNQTDPNTQRKHSFEDAMFIPDTMFKSVQIDPEDTENVVLQSLDGSQRVSVWENQVKITSADKIVIDAPLAEFTGAIIWGTNPLYGNTVEGVGDIVTTGDVISDSGSKNISLTQHVHDGVQPGGGNTGEPVG